MQAEYGITKKKDNKRMKAMSELYENLLKATNNVDDITTEKYAIITSINGAYCGVKEEESGLEHSNVPILNGATLQTGDKVVIGFLNNSIYDVVCYGALNINGASGVTIVDNLNSDSSTSALSAKQGKVLKDLIGDAISYINQ